jgi:hypothetical protein
LLQFIVILLVFSTRKAYGLGTLFPKKQVKTLHKKLKFTKKVEKNLIEKQIKKAKHL